MPAPENTDERIRTLTHEVTRLREVRHQDASAVQALLLGMTEVRLNLAHQDKAQVEQGNILKHLQHTLIGNGKPGLLTRVDRLEQTEKRRTKLVWVVVGAVVTTLVTGGGTMLVWVTGMMHSKP